MPFYHASREKGLETLIPCLSDHGTPLVYFSKKRENVLIYLSNAIEKYCRETGFQYDGKWTKWATYGFNRDGTLRIEEYYPNALSDTFKGVSGFIYRCDRIEDSGISIRIPDVAASVSPVSVTSCEPVPDAYDAILEAEAEKRITVLRYEDSSEAQLAWIRKMVSSEYEKAKDQPDYRHFLKGKFSL